MGIVAKEQINSPMEQKRELGVDCVQRGTGYTTEAAPQIGGERTDCLLHAAGKTGLVMEKN